MRCDDVPRLLATGAPLARWRARRHARNCPRCAAAAEELRSLIADLSDIPPLPARHRALWARAADGPAVRFGRPRLLRPVLGGIAAAAVGFVALQLAWWPAPAVPPVEARPDSAATLRRLDAMEAGLAPLDRELADLRRRADLLDARRDADRLLARYAWPERSRNL